MFRPLYFKQILASGTIPWCPLTMALCGTSNLHLWHWYTRTITSIWGATSSTSRTTPSWHTRCCLFTSGSFLYYCVVHPLYIFYLLSLCRIVHATFLATIFSASTHNHLQSHNQQIKPNRRGSPPCWLFVAVGLFWTLAILQPRRFALFPCWPITVVTRIINTISNRETTQTMTWFAVKSITIKTAKFWFCPANCVFWVFSLVSSHIATQSLHGKPINAMLPQITGRIP